MPVHYNTYTVYRIPYFHQFTSIQCHYNIAVVTRAPKADPKAGAKKKKEPKKQEEEDAGPKMDPPDKEAFEASLKEVQDAIDGLQAQQQELGKKISERSGGKDEYFAKRNEYKAQLNEFTAKIDALMARKDELNKGRPRRYQSANDNRGAASASCQYNG